MDHDLSIDERDVRAIVRLLGQVAGMNRPQVERKGHLMDGLCRLVEADAWLWSVTRVLHDQDRPVSIALLHGGLAQEQIAGWLEASQSNCPPPEDAPLSRETLRGVHFTRTRQQIVPDSQWYAHPAVQRHRLAVGLDHFLYSIYPIPEAKIWSCIGMFRHKGRQPFSDRDRRLAHIVISEIPWLHQAGIPEDQGVSVPQLPPRRRAVLIMLLEGLGRKDIARLLHISPHTAKEHMDAVYVHFGVSSQVELICRFRRGDGRDVIQE